MEIIYLIQIRNTFIRLLISIILCFFCLHVNAETSSQKTQANKGIFSGFFNKTKSNLGSYKIQLEMKYYEEQIKKEPKNTVLLETYGKYLKEHHYYDKSTKIYKKLIVMTKNAKYQIDIDEINSFKNYSLKNKSFEDLIKQAQIYEKQGQIKQANDYYLKAQKILPDRYEAKFGLAKTYCWISQPQKAMKYYEELLKKAPQNIALLEGYAGCLATTKDYSHAKEIYKKLLALTKNEKYKNKVQEIVSLEKGTTAKNANLATLNPQDKAFLDYIDQAQKYESKGKIQQANNYYLRAQKIYPKRYEALFGLAKTYGWLGQKKLANGFYKELLAMNPNNSDLKSAYNKFLKEITTTKSYQTANTTIVSPIEDYLKQAQKYEIQGNADSANKYYLKAYEIDKSRYEVKFGLAKTYGWLHKDKLAMDYYRELLKQTPNNNDLLDAYANYLKDTKNYSEAMGIYNKLIMQTKNEKYNVNIAELYFLQQDYSTSLKLYNDIYNKNPNNPDIQKSIALIYFVSGDFNKSIEFYQKYLAQKSDKESVLNYAKSLFYSKQIEPAKEILESYVKVYPNDVEGLSTLADIYMAQKNPKQAAELVSQALSIEPDNIKLKIQTAKIDIAAKNYCQAQNLLLSLLAIEPNNIEIIENLGDISFYMSNFNQALCYYKSIPDFKKNKRLIYKIAQSYHYNKNHTIAQNLYRQLICDSEYTNKAKIGLAEIEIEKDNPLKAIKILNNVLADDPENVQAKKNLGISYYSMGDNLKSIKILEPLPRDDSDIVYNLAKAYNGIDRQDIALDLLKNNPQENAKTLKGEIKMQTKTAIEPFYNFYYMNPNNGNANAGKYQKAGGNLYYYIKPNLRVVASGNATEYRNLNNIVSTMGMLGSIGLEGKPTNHLSYKSAIGYDAFNDDGANNLILGNAVAKYSPNDVVTFTGGYIRSLDEIDSYMSAAGVVPAVGPFANQLVGRIVDNKYIGAVSFKLPHKFYVYAGMNIGNKYGSNSPSNSYREIPMGLGKVVYSAKEEKHINQALLGYDFYYTGYTQDMSGFGGANLNYSPIGSDGQSPSPFSGFPGTGGYFSPTFFIANKFPLTLKGSFKNTKLKYILSGFIGTQTIQGQIGLLGAQSSGQSQVVTTPYYGWSIGLRYNEKERISWGFDYIFNNYMTVSQHLLKASVLIRF